MDSPTKFFGTKSKAVCKMFGTGIELEMGKELSVIYIIHTADEDVVFEP